EGANDSVAVLSLATDGSLTPKSRIKAQHDDFPAGVALDEQGHLYVANQHLGGKNPFAAAGSVAIYDIKKETEIGRFAFTDSYSGTTNFPLAICALRDGSKVYVASERDGAVYVLDTHDPSKPTLAAKLETGTHPSGMLMNHSQSRLFVANADSDT